jgi:hypothetical protein
MCNDSGKQDGSGKDPVAAVNDIYPKILGGEKGDKCSKALDRFSAKRDVPERKEKAEDRHPEEDVNLHQLQGILFKLNFLSAVFFSGGGLFLCDFPLPPIFNPGFV